MREGRDDGREQKQGDGSTPGTNNEMRMSTSTFADVASSREVDPASIKIDAELIEKQRIVFVNSAEEIAGLFDAFMGDKKVRLATAGYSAAPSGYEEPTTRFLSDLVEALGDDVGLVTSPTCDKGSIDAITSTVGQRAGAPLGYITADSYLAYINPDNFPADINREVFGQQLKFAFPDAAVYSRATAVLSNSFLVTGGRNASVSDFMNAIDNGNKVVVLLNEHVSSPAWDPVKNRVDNAAEYLLKMVQGNYEGVPLDNSLNTQVADFIEQHRQTIRTNVLFVNANAEGAVQEALEHLTKSTTVPTSLEEKVIDQEPAPHKTEVITSSFRQWAEDFCFQRGMFPEQAKEVVDRLMKSPASKPMEGRWDDSIGDYPPAIRIALSLALKAEAVSYIEETCPQAWFKPLFENNPQG